YENRGYDGLGRASRADRNQRKVLITRQWDRAIKLPDDIKEQIAEKIEQYIRSLWAKLQPGSGWKEVQREASRKLLSLTIDAKPDMPEGKIRNYCQISRPAIERWRQYSAIALHDMDAKAYFDKQPRIQRGIKTLLPMQVVMGDVHPIDILYQRDDGSLATAKGIFWQDVATGRLTGTVEFFPKGKGVRQEHVIESFAQMARDPRWGAPTELYLDNGGEYNWSKFVEDAMKLTQMPIKFLDNGKFIPSSDQAVTKAQPYNAPAKGLLEGAFAILEQKHFSKIPGWIGGDRMRKKTANVGKAPIPFQDSQEALVQAIHNAVAVYNDSPQGGRLKGLSPNQRFAELVDAGWNWTRFEDGLIESILCKREQRTIHQARIKYKGELYYHDALTNPALGDTVEVRIPLFGHQKRIAVFDRNRNFVCIALPDRVFDHGDRDGAIESGRRKTFMRKQIRAMRKETDKIDTLEILTEQAESIEPTPLPELGGVIKLSDQDERAGRELAKPLSEIEQEKKDDKEEYFRTFDKLITNKGPSVAPDDPIEPEPRQISLNQK
ncbi:MAG: Mu transposase C-terminal domain-containing protein, partial [Sneathiella sp.]